MRMLLFVGALATALGTASCACNHGKPYPVADTVPCDSGLAIDFKPDDTPTIDKETCSVVGGTTLIWRGPLNDSRRFTLIFDHGSPEETGGTEFLSSMDRIRQTRMIKIKKVSVETTLKYSIGSNSKVLDPHIIIKPSQ